MRPQAEAQIGAMSDYTKFYSLVTINKYCTKYQ